MNGKLSIRRAEEKDSSRISELLKELGYPIDNESIREKIITFSKKETEFILVAERENNVEGVLSFHMIPMFHALGNAGRITSLVVTEKFRGMGIGRRLIEHAEAWAWEKDCKKIEITSGDHRINAHGFYEKNGYKLEDRRFLKTKS